ncbi:MAG TPA: glutamine amidotransferase [Armatimonadota bacterium]|jgi:uncharacterized membrane protein
MSTRPLVLCAVLALLSPLRPLLAADAPPPSPPPVTITDDGMKWSEYAEGKKRQGNRLFRQTGLTRDYALALHEEQTKQPDGTWQNTYSSVGMPQPIQGNWYHGGFFSITGNNLNLTATEPTVETIETGAQGVLDFTWEHALAKVRVRFVLQSGSDHLLMEVRWEPKPDLKTLAISLSCYPEGFRVSEPDRLAGVKLDRHMLTADRDVEQVQTVDLNLATEWWQYYQDNTLEKSPTYGLGGAALVVLPEELDKVTAQITDYPVVINLNPQVARGRCRLALWDFNGTANSAALKTLKDEAPGVRATMAADPWLPTAITGFSPAAEGQRLEALGGALGSGQSGKLSALRQRVATLNAQRGAFLDNRSFAGESALRQAISDYRLAYWQAERPTVKKVRTLFLAGPWAYGWRLDEAARAAWGADAVKQGGYIWKEWMGNFLTYFPATREELLSYDVVVLADLPQDPFTDDKRQRLADYVTQGGGLLVLGGTYAGGAGKWAGSPLEPLLPVTMGSAFDLAASGQALAVTAAGTKRLGKITPPLGMVPWRSKLLPRPGAEVWMTAGKDPFAVYAPAGAGRVAYVLGTAYGEAPAGKTAFWDTPGWQQAAVRMLGWLARGK